MAERNTVSPLPSVTTCCSCNQSSARSISLVMSLHARRLDQGVAIQGRQQVADASFPPGYPCRVCLWRPCPSDAPAASRPPSSADRRSGPPPATTVATTTSSVLLEPCAGGYCPGPRRSLSRPSRAMLRKSRSTRCGLESSMAFVAQSLTGLSQVQEAAPRPPSASGATSRIRAIKSPFPSAPPDRGAGAMVLRPRDARRP